MKERGDTLEARSAAFRAGVPGEAVFVLSWAGADGS